MKKVIVVGGGAAGLIAAYVSALNGNNVILFEKNEKLGKKIYITGKGRCNLTNDIDVLDFFKNVVTNPKFIFSAIHNLSPKMTQELFESLGLKLKVERGNRVFPLSDKASDVTKTLEKALKQNNVDVRLNTDVIDIVHNNSTITGVNTTEGFYECDSLILCTGGISYSSTGSDGDGYKFAKKTGHSIVELKPSLVGINLKNVDFIPLQGLSLKNVAIKATCENKTVYKDFGEMLFTHFGISGPIVLSCSSFINKYDVSKVKISIDLKPALDEKTIDNRLLKEFKENNVKTIATTLRSMLPKALIETILNRATINQNKKCSEITHAERSKLVYLLKNFDFSVKSLRPIDEAIVTSGGVCVNDINPKTMESKKIKNLFFAGELIDVDALTGGFNLQIAFSTGYLAGKNA